MRKLDFAVKTFALAQYGSRLGLRREGETVAKEIWRALEGLPRPGVLQVDLTGLEVLSASFADAALAGPLYRLVNGELPERYIYAVSPDREIVEDLGGKLEQRGLAMLVLFPDSWDVLGKLVPSLREALGLVIGKGEMTSAELAEILGISPKAAAVRLKELSQKRLVHFIAEPRPVGGIRRRAVSFLALPR